MAFLPSVALGTLLTTNLFLVISTNLRPQAHCPERRCTLSTPPSSAISTCWQILVLLTRNSALIEVEFIGTIGTIGTTTKLGYRRFLSGLCGLSGLSGLSSLYYSFLITHSSLLTTNSSFLIPHPLSASSSFSVPIYPILSAQKNMEPPNGSIFFIYRYRYSITTNGWSACTVSPSATNKPRTLPA